MHTVELWDIYMKQDDQCCDTSVLKHNMHTTFLQTSKLNLPPNCIRGWNQSPIHSFIKMNQFIHSFIKMNEWINKSFCIMQKIIQNNSVMFVDNPENGSWFWIFQIIYMYIIHSHIYSTYVYAHIIKCFDLKFHSPSLYQCGYTEYILKGHCINLQIKSFD